MKCSFSKNSLYIIPFILHGLINRIIFLNTECCFHGIKGYHIFKIFDIFINFIINSSWFQHNNPTSVQKSRRKFLCCMIKINRCEKTKMLWKLKAFGSAKRDRTIRHRCKIAISEKSRPVMLYRAEIGFIKKNNKRGNSGLITIIFPIHSFKRLEGFSIAAFHSF